MSVDSVAVASGDRILVKNQVAQLQNGIYSVTATGAVGAVFVLTRTDDFDDSTNISSGAFTFTEVGTVNADNGYVMTTDGTISPGVTAIVWSQFSGAGMVEAGDGLDKTGNTLSVNVDGTSLAIAADTLQIKSTYVGQTSLTTLGTVGTGVWQGTAVADAYVANDLTISGGTVNSSIIGGSTPAAGTFTTLTANTSLVGTLGTAAQTNITSIGTIVAGQFGTDAVPLTAFLSGGEVDGVVIGGETPAAATVTTLTINDGLTLNAGMAVNGDTTGEITLNVKGVGSQTAALMTVEQSDGTDKLSVSAAGVTTIASADINAGNIDGTAIGGATPAAGAFTTVSATTAIPIGSGGTGLTAAAKGSVIIANAANTLSALDGGGSNDGLLAYTSSSDTIAWATAVEGGTF